MFMISKLTKQVVFQSGNLEKLNKAVSFPEMLNLSPYLSGMSDKYPVYRLYAVVVHLGIMNAAYSGHYVSYIKDVQGAWFRIDDSRVCYCTQSRFLNYLSTLIYLS